MYKTKKEVDAHVRTALSKLRSETERNLRCFTIAKLYYRINEYASAEHYLCSYLSVKDDNDQAHKLLGQCYQRLKKTDKALQSFQRSLQLNPKQPDVLADVCQLLLDDKNLNVNKAKYWCDLAESEKVQHDAVFSLRLKLMNKESAETNQVDDMIQKEIRARPNDVQLRVRLLRSYMEQNKVLDAFKYVYNLEMSMQENFNKSGEWYNIVWLVLNKYDQIPNTKKDWEYWLLLIICLERQVDISFSLTPGYANAGLTETANLLFNLDQYLYKVTQLCDKLCAQQELINLFLDHYRGQMLIHAVALIFKRELLQNKNKWKETVKIVLPLLLLAFQVDTPDNKEPWMKHADEQGKQLIQLWGREGSFRCAQAGRTLLACIADETSTNKENATAQINNIFGNNPTLWNNSDELLSQVRQICSDKQWRRNVFAVLYCNSDQKVKEQTSLLIKSPKLNEPIFELPTYAEVERYEETAQYLKPQSLQHMVYLALGNDNLAYVRAKYFSGLNFSTQNLAFCGAESLNQLDMDTFLYAATIQAKQTLNVERETFENYTSGGRSSSGRPRMLPFVNLQGQLCTEEQSNWWLAAYQVYKNLSNENLAELRANLQFGIEAVRGVNGPKIDMIIVFRLGQIFVARSQDIVKPVEKAFLEARAENIYKYGLNMVKMNNKGVLEPFRKFFKFPKANSSAIEREVANAAEDAVSYLASRYFKKAEYEDLIEELAGIQLPFATYMQAEAYRKLDEASKTPQKAKRMYLDRASECLLQTLNLLKSTETNPDHPLNSIINTEIKRLQQSKMRFLKDDSPHNSVHNNSSTYEDAEGDFYHEMSLAATPALHRTRRETIDAAILSSPRYSGLESLVKQMANTLSLVKEELVDTIKPEMLSMRKEITGLKDKISSLEEAMKRTRISSNAPSHGDDEACQVLDENDLYMIEDALQSQLYQTPTQSQHLTGAAAIGGNAAFAGTVPNNAPPHAGGVHSPFLTAQQQANQQQQRNSMHMQPNNNMAAAAAAAAAYNSPMFNPTYPMNYYTQQPYMMPPQPQAQAPPPTAGAMLSQRNALPLPYGDAGLSFSMPSATPLLPAPPQDARTSNLYSLLTQPPTALAPQLPQLPSAPAITSNLPLSNTSALGALPPTTIASSGIQFNKALNNQPVEKGPPANVVITSSDPLPNPNRSALITQQPTLSVTIPPHHIKSSLVATAETSAAAQPPLQSNTNIQNSSSANAVSVGSVGIGGGFAGFGFGSSAATNTPTPFNIAFNNSFATTTMPTAMAISCTATSTSSSATSIFNKNSIGSLTSIAPSTTTTISATTFTFRPQIEQAQAASAAAAGLENISSDNSFTALNKTADSFNKSGNEAEPEYDPRPDFKPLIPLPDEIEVRTGEEDEEIMFCCRAKLYRYVDKEWKERGTGDIKILKNNEGTSRILMRREKTHKICANHKITKELILTTPNNETKGLIWAAKDFSDEELKTERFFVRFKLPESAEKFRDAFIAAQKGDEQKVADKKVDLLQKKNETTQQKQQQLQQQQQQKSSQPPFALTKSAVSNFATSTPATKANAADTMPAVNAATTAKPSANTNANTNAADKTTALPSTNNVSKTLFAGMSAPFLVAAADNNNKKDDAQTNANKASPFANFTFDKSRANNAGGLFGSATTTTAAPPTTFANILGNFGNAAATSPFSIGNLPAFQPPSTAAVATTTTTTGTAGVPAAPATTLNKSNTSDAGDEYVPTATFNPVIPLPDLVEVSTGEENEIVLFEYRAKLLRFDKTAGEWKERGIGNIKLLQDKSDADKVRLVMRREQIHKLCCNQRLYKNTVFKYAKNSQTALTWAGQDYSENELVTEMLTVRFKLAETCKQFHEAVLKAQANMSDEADERNVAKSNANEQQRNQENAKEKVSAAESSFTFGKPMATSSGLNADGMQQQKTAAAGFGDKFKLKAGEWNCKDCYLSNKEDDLYCQACNAPKNDTVPKKEATNNLLTLSNPTQKFNFGFGAAVAAAATTNTAGTATTTTTTAAATTAMPAAKPSAAASANASSKTTTTATSEKATNKSGFGDKFKPKAGEWKCDDCYLSNNAEDLYCQACNAPKDDSVPKKDTAPTSNLLALSNPTQKFSFGFSAAAAAAGTAATANTVNPSAGDANASTKPTVTSGFSFGMPPATDTAAAAADATFSFADNNSAGTNNNNLSKPTFSFSLQSKAMDAPAMPTATGAGGESKPFSFTLKPKSPGKAGNSPLKFGGGGDADAAAEDAGDDGDYQEEENNTYFTPVIPLPEKIDVKTGEEDEEVLYVHRAKLYRYVENEWKERGLGDVKILRHKETKKLRVVMRREQVLKICLNHVLNDEVKYQAKDDKSWLFVVNDFSEGAVELEKFSLRFKNKEIAQGFMDAVKSALAGTAKPIEESSSSSSGSNKSNAKPATTNGILGLAKGVEEKNKLENKTPTSLSEADKATADKLQLPYEFFTAKPTCTGCRGCDPDQFVFPTVNALAAKAFIGADEDAGNALEPNELPQLSLAKTATSASRSLLKQSALAAATKLNTSGDGSPKSAEANIFSGAGGMSASSFSFTKAVESTQGGGGVGGGGVGGAASGGFLFGDNSNASFGSKDTAKPIFGQQSSIFGNFSNTLSKPADSTTTTAVPEQSPSSGGFVFGAKPVFGSLFDAKTNTTANNDTTKMFFGNAGNLAANASKSTSLFGGSTFAGLGNAPQTSIFGGGNANANTSAKDNVNNNMTSGGSLFGSVTPQNATTTTHTASFADFSSKAGVIDFATLAAKANTETSKSKADAKPGTGGFIGLTDEDAFSSFSKTDQQNVSKDNEADESTKSADDNDNYDPHYDPIIPLPKEIKVSTGEENEVKLFGERAKLYRYDGDSKMWKERGVGELKLLKHKTKNTYRMLMHREQVLKLVLNHLVGPDFTFNNMNNDPKSFIWATLNYAESPEGELEKLAVRFKNTDLADQFKQKLEEAIENAKQRTEEITEE